MKNLKKFIVPTLALVLMTACNNKQENTQVSYKDGLYTGESAVDEHGGKVEVSISIKDGMIETVDMKNLDKDGKEKAEEYGMENGKITNEGLYKIAQDAVELSKSYPDELIAKQDIEQVEAISGATSTHKQFKEAVKAALSDANQ